MKILNKPQKLDNGDYLCMVDYETNEQGYGKDVKDRIMTADEVVECLYENTNQRVIEELEQMIYDNDLPKGMFIILKNKIKELKQK